MVSAAAKVNLALEVLGRRDDGYHEIATVMQAVDLSDRLVLEDGDVLELRTTASDVPTDGTNLALKAALTLREMSGARRGARITLDKRIPVAAGLGGGSTDAAAVLVGLNRLWGLRWPVARLAEVALRLGMDVPFFLHGGAALATGRGERLEPLVGSALALVLVNPRVAASTAEIYGGVVAGMYSDGARARRMAAALRSRQPSRVAASLGNTLERVASPRYREVEQMEAALLAAGALGAAMSGSGLTVFGVARSYDHARQIRARVVRARWGCWAVRTLRGPAVRIRR
ncbi:MAG TPA: 4-(cytidine 5'-diphospho)-2-C-methyl-D-erythritol kinase [Candidatus Binatia bacterium]|nr:4-(cytidine 5'-diphospho)-2-C-methyl-D-erythritol kinase [Candidatus Binatia bacterium]